MNLEVILDRLQEVKRSGPGWMARCPAHDDKNPSLSLREENGKVLLHCFAGCTVKAICVASEIEVRDLFSEPCSLRKLEPRVVRDAKKQLMGLRSRLGPRDRERAVTLVLANELNLVRALALAVEGELLQVSNGR